MISPDGPDVEKCVRYINHEIRKNLFITQLMAFFERFTHLLFLLRILSAVLVDSFYISASLELRRFIKLGVSNGAAKRIFLL